MAPRENTCIFLLATPVSFVTTYKGGGGGGGIQRPPE